MTKKEQNATPCALSLPQLSSVWGRRAEKELKEAILPSAFTTCSFARRPTPKFKLRALLLLLCVAWQEAPLKVSAATGMGFTRCCSQRRGQKGQMTPDAF